MRAAALRAGREGGRHARRVSLLAETCLSPRPSTATGGFRAAAGIGYDRWDGGRDSGGGRCRLCGRDSFVLSWLSCRGCPSSACRHLLPASGEKDDVALACLNLRRRARRVPSPRLRERVRVRGQLEQDCWIKGQNRATAPTPKTPIKFLYLSPPPRLEPLCASAAYSRSRDRKTFSRQNKRQRCRPAGWRPSACPASIRSKGPASMMDIILLGTAVVFFGLCFAYTRACDRL